MYVGNLAGRYGLGDPQYVAPPQHGEPWTPEAVRSFMWQSGLLKVADATNSTYALKAGVAPVADQFADRYGWTQTLLNAAGVLYTLPPGVGGIDPSVTQTAVQNVTPGAGLSPASGLVDSGSTTLPGSGFNVTTTLYPGQTSLPPETQESGLQNSALLLGLMGLGLLVLLPAGRSAVRYRRKRAARRVRR